LLRHEEALRLLAHDLKDFQGAETYCYSGGTFIESTKSKVDHAALQRELFRQLLGEYLRLENMNDRVTQTVNLLDRWGRFFDIKMVSLPNLNADMSGLRCRSG
jgi:vacuolar protein sorting-associated protein 3